MDAIKVTLGGTSLLLPDSHSDNYEFPTYIIENKELIKNLVDAGNEIIKHTSNPFSKEMDAAEKKAKELSQQSKKFKEVTGVIGWPFDMRDADLYAAQNNINVILSMSL